MADETKFQVGDTVRIQSEAYKWSPWLNGRRAEVIEIRGMVSTLEAGRQRLYALRVVGYGVAIVGENDIEAFGA